MSAKFKAMIVREDENGRFSREISERCVEDLPAGEILVKVAYSSLNYKDALSATGNRGVTKNYPHTPGIDAAGVVEASDDPEFAAGEEVIVTGHDLGMNTPGGFGGYVRVPSGWVVKLPENLSLFESMVYGTAGFTAGLSVLKLVGSGVRPGDGKILVTGSTGGVGSVAVGILSKIGYVVTAETGKMEESAFLFSLGATEVVKREEALDVTGKPLLKGAWAGAVDTVGGDMLSAAVRATKYGGSITCCGNVSSNELSVSIFPFILRGVNLLGVASAECPTDLRLEVWKRLSGEWKLESLGDMATECSLGELDGKIDAILEGKLKGRTVVNLEK